MNGCLYAVVRSLHATIVLFRLMNTENRKLTSYFHNMWKATVLRLNVMERASEWANEVVDHLTKMLVKRITHRSYSSNIQAERKLINLLGSARPFKQHQHLTIKQSTHKNIFHVQNRWLCCDVTNVITIILHLPSGPLRQQKTSHPVPFRPVPSKYLHTSVISFFRFLMYSIICF